MKKLDIKVLGQSATYEVTTSVDEMNKLAGSDVAHGHALNQVLAHNVYGRIRANVVDNLESRFQDDKRKTEKTKVGDRTVERVVETDAVYVQRLLAAGKITEADIAKAVQAAADAYPIGEALKVKPRESKPKVISKTLRTKLEGATDDQRAALAKKLTKSLKRDIDAADIDALGFAYLEHKRAEEAKREAQLFS